MKTLLLAAFSIAALAACSAPARDPRLTGLWQFPERSVWLQIHSDGNAYQCRIAPGGVVIQSRGRFIDPTIIEWEEEWKQDAVKLRDGTVLLDGEYGAFAFHPADGAMSPACSKSRASVHIQ